jgi:hypothetical protein
VAIRAAGCIAQPIESGETGLGIPDMFIRTESKSAWVEFKNTKYLLVYPYTVPFRPGQCAWLERYYQLGGTSLLVIGSLEGIFVFHNKAIKRVYESDLIGHCSSHFLHVVGKSFIAWLNKL